MAAPRPMASLKPSIFIRTGPWPRLLSTSNLLPTRNPISISRRNNLSPEMSLITSACSPGLRRTKGTIEGSLSLKYQYMYEISNIKGLKKGTPSLFFNLEDVHIPTLALRFS